MTKKKAEVKKPKQAPEDIQKQEEQTKTEIVKVIQTVPEGTDAFGKLSSAQIELIKRTIADGASDDELRLFLQVCKGANINPFLRQAHLIPFWDGKAGSERRAIVIAIDGFRAIAESSGKYAGNDDAVFQGEVEIELEIWEGKGGARKKVGTRKKKVPEKASVTVYKMMDGVRCPFTASARWDEYYPGGRKGGKWNDMPHVMLGKCAEALALRKGFPKQLSGLYAQEEMDQAMNASEEEQKVSRGFATLMRALENPNVTGAQIREFKEKIQASDKYTVEQKAEFVTAADAVLDRLKKKAKVHEHEEDVIDIEPRDMKEESPRAKAMKMGMRKAGVDPEESV